MNIPKELKYTKEHEWVRLDDDQHVTVGITDYAQGELGDIVFVEIEAEGEDLDQNETFGSVEAVKTVSDLYMPVSGEVVKVNEEINEDPSLVNQDPYGKGWMIQIKCSDKSELEQLLSAEDYEELVS